MEYWVLSSLGATYFRPCVTSRLHLANLCKWSAERHFKQMYYKQNTVDAKCKKSTTSSMVSASFYFLIFSYLLFLSTLEFSSNWQRSWVGLKPRCKVSPNNRQNSHKREKSLAFIERPWIFLFQSTEVTSLLKAKISSWLTEGCELNSCAGQYNIYFLFNYRSQRKKYIFVCKWKILEKTINYMARSKVFGMCL